MPSLQAVDNTAAFNFTLTGMICATSENLTDDEAARLLDTRFARFAHELAPAELVTLLEVAYKNMIQQLAGRPLNETRHQLRGWRGGHTRLLQEVNRRGKAGDLIEVPLDII